MYEYIAKTHKSQFINDDTIMFDMDDVKALVDRFLRENFKKYRLLDLMPKIAQIEK